MATISCFPCGIACVSDKKIILASLSDKSRQEIDISKPALNNSEDQSIQKKEGGKDDTSEQKERNKILCFKFSPRWNFFAACDAHKQLYLFGACGDWNLISSRSIIKRCSAITFTNDESNILVADRHGDVYKFSVTNPKEEGKLVLGHLSMLLDIVVTSRDQYIVTCDRDEKIRISHYPNAYSIHSYCLHHSQYVTSLVYVEAAENIISGGGDGRIIVWNLNGKKLACNDDGERETTPVKKLVYCRIQKIIAAMYFGSTEIKIYQMMNADSKVALTYCDSIKLQDVPWDMEFDEKSQLWLLQPVEDCTVSVYRCTCNEASNVEMKMERVTTEINTDKCFGSVLDMLNADWDFFKVSCEIDDSYQNLKKKPIDSFAEYLQERKESRPKRDNSVKEESSSDNKKIKVS